MSSRLWFPTYEEVRIHSEVSEWQQSWVRRR